MAQLQESAKAQEALSLPIRYADPEYNSIHHNLFSKSLINPLETVLPPGVSQADFDTAIIKLKDVLGDKNVYIGKALAEYIDPYELQEEPSRRKVPSGAVCPATVAEAQGVLKIANKFKIPVWTFSRGKNLG